MEKVNPVWPILILATVSIAAAQTPQLPADYAEKLASLELARQAHPDDMQILDALSQDEKNAQDKAKKQPVRGTKKAEKDW